MRCPTCGYDLHGLRRHICPECGGAFDPGALEHDDQIVQRTCRMTLWVYLVSGLWPLLAMAWLHLMFIMARLALGRWPRPYEDDPRSITIIREMSTALGFACMLLLVLPVVMLVAWAQLLILKPRQAMALAPVGMLSWVVFFVLLRWDPFGAVTWFID